MASVAPRSVPMHKRTRTDQAVLAEDTNNEFEDRPENTPSVSIGKVTDPRTPILPERHSVHTVDSSIRPRSRGVSLDQSVFNHTSPGSSTFHDDLFKTERPLSDPHVFRLLRYYVDIVAPWLDLTDSRKQFARVVPQEALNFPPLFSAILAFSAQQLRKENETYQNVAELCYTKCVAELIPVLEYEESAADGRVLAATVILRMYEMHQYSIDPQQHLSGSWSLLQVPRSDAFDGLRVAAFWVYLRQDIQMAERYSRPTMIDLDHCQFQSTYDTYPTEEDFWANRMIWAYGHVINYCFGSQVHRTWERWEFLDKKIEQWKHHRPASYEPIFYGMSNVTSVFPAIWFLSGWHVYGAQTFHMAKLLLNLYAPESNAEGLERLQEQRQREESLQQHARIICGILATNSYQAARIHACEHIRTCHRIIALPEEHLEIARLLEVVELETGWPVTKLISDA